MNQFRFSGKTAQGHQRLFALSIIAALFCTTSLFSQKTKLDSLRQEINKLKRLENFSKRDTNYINLRNKLASTYRFLESDSLHFISKQTLKLSKEIDYKSAYGYALDNLGDYYSDKGDSDKAIEYYSLALPVANDIGNKELQLSILNNLAGEYGYMGNYAKSLNGYLKGIDLATEVDDKKMLSILNENIANLYASQKDYSQALEFYEKVKKINKEIGNEVISAETMSNVASVYVDIKKFDYAMFNVNKSIEIFEKHQILDWLAFAYEVKGRIYLRQKKYHWALYWYRESAQLHEQLDDDRGKIDLLNGIAETYLSLEKDSLSLAYAKKGYAISKKLNSLQGQISCTETLYKIHKDHHNFDKALEFHEVFQKLSDSLSKDENRRSLSLLETKIEYDKQRQELIEENEKALAKQRNYIYLAVSILLILAVITILVYRSEKIQKKLYKELQEKSNKLIEREAELSEINRTKSKLFSIIAHDLRGPIGALQGLLKMFSSNEIERKEFFSLVPKFKTDVDHIFFTLNNLLSWGQAQMNGVITKPRSTSLDTIVNDNISLLSEVAAKKSIKVLNQLPENTIVWADIDQIDIVVRNLISNALKFTPENGLITIEGEESPKNWEILVRDTGIGMDEETQKKIFSDTSNLTTYGTNNEKGTGLGLSLCKEMIEKNKGKIWVESFPRKGSCFHFTIPKASKSYKQAG